MPKDTSFPSLTSSSFRTTQRAPRSCRNCSTRKVRCDKSIPCARCVKRGEADTCVRETVIVRGQVTTRKNDSGVLAYEELLQENARLRDVLAGREEEEASDLTFERLDADDYYEKAFFNRNVLTPNTLAGLCNIEDVLLPNRHCSEALVAHDKKWNSWVHYALEYPQFAQQHAQFRRDLEDGMPLLSMDSYWLSIYFAVLTAALLTMDEIGIAALELPVDNVQHVQRNWYDASLFFLQRADFMRRPSIQAVQSIAIQGMSYVNFGDWEMYRIMWACAIRISQMIGLDRTSNLVMELGQETQHRLWWTLLICDWMGGGPTTSLVREDDYNVPLPSITEDGVVETSEGATVHAVQYHIFMSRTARAYQRFKFALRDRRKKKMDITRAADEELAELIDTLPNHLQPDREIAEVNDLEQEHPWIRWQRVDLTLVLLYHRLCIYRILQREWMDDPVTFASPRAVCLRTARDIIWISQNWEVPLNERRQWPFAMYLFCAGLLLVQEARHGLMDDEPDWILEVEKCIHYLEQVSHWNVIANQSFRILQERLQEALLAT